MKTRLLILVGAAGLCALPGIGFLAIDRWLEQPQDAFVPPKRSGESQLAASGLPRTYQLRRNITPPSDEFRCDVFCTVFVGTRHSYCKIVLEDVCVLDRREIRNYGSGFALEEVTLRLTGSQAQLMDIAQREGVLTY